MGQGVAHGRVALQQLHFFAAFGKHLLQHGALRIHLRFLVHQHDPGLGQGAPFARSRRFQARQQAHQGGFAGTVGANQPQALFFPHMQGQVVKKGADAEVFAHPHQADQAHALEGWRWPSR